MRKLITFIILLITCSIVKAQSGYSFIDLSGGYFRIPNNGFNGHLSLDFSNKYHNEYDIYIDGFAAKYIQHYTDSVNHQAVYRSKNTTNQNFLIGVTYKPVLLRNKNTTFRFKGGMGIGSNTQAFVYGFQIGLQLEHTLSNGFEVYIAQNDGLIFRDEQNWRMGASIGFKIPLTK